MKTSGFFNQVVRFASSISRPAVPLTVPSNIRANPSPLQVQASIAEAIASNQIGVVALESTVITHGLPYPQNLEIATELESIIRDEGVLPATIAVLNGKLRVGLNANELEQLATSKAALKVSRRDMAYAIATNPIGGTTVSGTMFAAHQAGIRIFATGGIGGVHRGASETFDISADLTELGRTPVTVVCAGVKSILDVPKTLEYLETQGVPVIVHGADNKFPGFFIPDSGSLAPHHLQTIDELADVLVSSHSLQMQNGQVIACPIPSRPKDNQLISDAIETALRESREQNVSGNRITPFLLERITDLTGGASLEANLTLLRNNARIAAQLARRVVEKENGTKQRAFQPSRIREEQKLQQRSTPDVVVIGATMVDFHVNSIEPLENCDGTTYTGHTSQHCGGVGRNHADALTRLGLNVRFISAIGQDANAELVKRNCEHMCFDGVERVPDLATATYAAICERGLMQYGIGNISEMTDRITPKVIQANEEWISTARLVLIDGNLPNNTIKCIADMTKTHKRPLWFEPTDRRKVTKILDTKSFDAVHALSPNRNELIEFCKAFDNCDLIKIMDQSDGSSPMEVTRTIETSNFIARIMEQLNLLVITCGPDGVFVCYRELNDQFQVLNPRQNFDVMHIPPPDFEGNAIESVSGAGDCFNAGLIASVLSGNQVSKFEDHFILARNCAKLSLLSERPVPVTL